MNNFGVIELAGARTTTAPGWAYVPDTAIAPGSAGIQPANRKRARNQTGGGPSLSDLTARQETKMRKEIEVLERDGARDNTIPLPPKAGRAQTKFTPNVRKVMQSQKTFANHLDDYLALQALTESNNAAANNSKRSGGSSSKKGTAASTPKPSGADDDVVMADAKGANVHAEPVLPPPYRAPPVAHPGDNDPLLASRVPEMPSDEELRKLLAQPPLPYLEARGDWVETYPRRVFCRGLWILGQSEVPEVRDKGMCIGVS